MLRLDTTSVCMDTCTHQLMTLMIYTYGVHTRKLSALRKDSQNQQHRRFLTRLKYVKPYKQSRIHILRASSLSAVLPLCKKVKLPRVKLRKPCNQPIPSFVSAAPASESCLPSKSCTARSSRGGWIHLLHTHTLLRKRLVLANAVLFLYLQSGEGFSFMAMRKWKDCWILMPKLRSYLFIKTSEYVHSKS